MPTPFFNPNLTLEEEAMPGSTVEATQKAQRAKVSRANLIPSQKELAKMSPKKQREVISRTTSVLTSRAEEVFRKAETDLTAIEAEIALSEAEALAAQAAGQEAAIAGETALAEGDKIITEAVESGELKYPDLPDIFKDVVNKQPQYSDAGLAAAIAALSGVGVEGLTDVMAEIRKVYPGIDSEEALTLLKYDKRFNAPYLKRFAGNKLLQERGFGMLDDKEYLATEKAYNKIFTSYGLKQFANQDKYASLIGNAVSADELAGRVSTAYDRVIKGARETKDALNQLFPELNDTDILAYALDPVNQLPAIQRKVQAAEIGGAALAQSLSTGLQAAAPQASGFTNVKREGLGVEELQAQGIDLAEARKGYAAVAEVLPTAEKLSAIYGDRLKQYGRKEAEQEAFLDLASARRARKALTDVETAQFSGTSGRGRIGKSVGGQIQNPGWTDRPHTVYQTGSKSHYEVPARTEACD